MEWYVIITHTAEKRLRKIPNPDRRRLLAAIGKLQDGLIGDIKPLKGRDEWRLRVGEWRVILSIDAVNRIIRVTHVDVRGDVYKD